MLIKIILLSVLLAIIVFCVLRYNILLFLFIVRKHKQAIYVPSFNRHLALMKKSLPFIPGKTLLDLGCGDGKALRFFTRYYGVKCQGYDINSFAITYGKIINFIKKYKIQLFLKDFSTAPLAEANYIYLYLFPEQMASIEDWVFSTIKKDAVVVSNTFQFKKKLPFQTIKDRKGKDRIFLYRNGSN